jgi:hypothetical protein
MTEPQPTPTPSSPPAKPPAARIDAAPILNLEEERCPNCGVEVQPGDLVCLKCGYDFKANTVRTVRTEGPGGAGEGADAEEAFVPEPGEKGGRGGARVWVVIGAVLTVGAMVVAGLAMPGGAAWYVVLGGVVLVLYNVAVHTATGFGAVAIAARVCEQRLGSFEQAAARIFTAYAVFELVRHVQIPALGRFGPTVVHVLAGGAYFLAVWGLFRKSRAVTLLIVLTHFVLWIVFELGMVLSGAVHAARAAAAASGAGAG